MKTQSKSKEVLAASKYETRAAKYAGSCAACGVGHAAGDCWLAAWWKPARASSK